MRSDSVKNMSAYADQNHAPSLAAARLEFQEYREGENQESPEADAAMEVVAASVLLSYKLEVNKSGLFHSLRSK